MSFMLFISCFVQVQVHRRERRLIYHKRKPMTAVTNRATPASWWRWPILPAPEPESLPPEEDEEEEEEEDDVDEESPEDEEAVSEADELLEEGV